MFGFGHWELIMILLIVFVVFGAKRLPGLGKGLGEGINSFRKTFKNASEADSKELAASAESEATEA